ncbi:PREDICTED: protein DYAD [Tarenaya hassleriana]|uniref:protein DYAD n=1 Tax=Tarenaya hassleriana TaxID=28532 RepID=UPI00053C53B5|nr:PREDICTED: protein DYAD [Tarenaya hassleriana]
MYLISNPVREAIAGDSSSSPPVRTNETVAHLKVGSYYEIDVSSLPQRSPEQLRFIRIAMVSKITSNHVSLRYPSMYSLRSHFGGGGMNRNKPEKGDGVLPLLDESHAMGSEIAGEVLYRRIPPDEVSMRRNSPSFWVSDMDDSSCKEKINWPIYTRRPSRAASWKGSCWSELRSAGMVNWGKRLRVRYQSRHIDEKKNEAGKEGPAVKKEEEEQTAKKDVEEEDAGNETESTDEGGEKGAIDRRNSSRKRKPCGSDSQRPAQRAKETKPNKQNQIAVYKKKVAKKFIDRWSVERYKLAEKNMLKVMKEQNALFGNPILRSELRSEARKLIGDTGLLDHLLKHMAGKVAPGGQDRFRRRHNANGAMEYWLESSDLVHVRKEAGVQDPYWTPPPGWKLGDNPTQDPVCAREIREMREGLASLRREMEKLASKKQEENLAMVTTPSSCVTSQTLDHENLMIPAKEMYAELLKKKDQIEEQLAIVSESLHKMEEDMGWLQSTMEAYTPNTNKNDSEDTLPPLLLESPPAITEEDEDAKEVNEGKLITEITPNTNPPEEEEAKPVGDNKMEIVRSSGFRICRPVGSFLWPNMAAVSVTTAVFSPNPTTGLVTSPPSQQCETLPILSPPPLIKPLAAKRPVLVDLPVTVARPESSRNLNQTSPSTIKAAAGNTAASVLTFPASNLKP